MTRLEQTPRFAPSPQGIAMIRERLHRMGLPASDAAARSLIEAVLAFEGPRLYAAAQGNLENSLEIIRDTAESADLPEGRASGAGRPCGDDQRSSSCCAQAPAGADRRAG
jgi:hypothetical protein